MASSSSGQPATSTSGADEDLVRPPRWLPSSSSPRRMRHIASIHLRNFTPVTTNSSGHTAQPHLSSQLYHISLALASTAAAPSTPSPFLTDPSRPAVNADWQIHTEDLARSCASTSTSKQVSLLGRSHLRLVAWAKKESDDEAALAGEWEYAWEKEVDLNQLQRIPGGLSSPSAARLPHNSLILGLRSSVWSGLPSHEQHAEPALDKAIVPEGSKTAPAEAAKVAQQRLAAAGRDHRARDAVTYFLVPATGSAPALTQPAASDAGSSKAQSATAPRSSEAGDISILNGASSEPEDGSDDSSSDEEGDPSVKDAGYDSETTFELSSSQSVGSSRPGLDRRRSSSRTIRALKKGRRRRGTGSSKASAGGDEAASLHTRSSSSASSKAAKTFGASPMSKKEQDRRQQVQRWQLEREREREVLERSKWETRMLQGYDREQLRSILEAQVDVDAAVREEDDAREASNCALLDNAGLYSLRRKGASTKGKLASLEEVLEEEKGKAKELKGKIEGRREALARRRARLEVLHRQRAEQADEPAQESKRIEGLRSRLTHLDALTHNRRAHLLDTLSLIYPIRLLSPADLLFSIGGCTLPNAPAAALAAPRAADKVDEDEISAALGMAAQLGLLVSAYLETPLHYDVAAAGSKAMVRDGISMMNGPRSFPLYSKGVEPYRFEYGVFLLNKNVEQLMNVHGLPVLDLRHLLPNLNNLLLTLSSPVAVPPEQGEAASSPNVVGNGMAAGASASNGSGDSSTVAPGSGFSSPPSSSVDSPTRKRRGGYKMAGKGEIVLPSTPRSAVMDGEGSVEHGETAKEEGTGVNGGRLDGTATSSISNATATGKKQAANANAHSPAASWTASLLGWTTGGGGGAGSRHRKASGQQDAKKVAAPPPPGNLPTARRLGGGSG